MLSNQAGVGELTGRLESSLGGGLNLEAGAKRRTLCRQTISEDGMNQKKTNTNALVIVA